MSRRGWSGRKVRGLVDACLAWRGTVCHLCGEPGADSADHDPPRSVLLKRGVPNPDDLIYLWPSHKLCNIRRQAREITAELRAELRRRRRADTERVAAAAAVSPRFIKGDLLRIDPPSGSRRSSFFLSDPAGGTTPPDQEK